MDWYGFKLAMGTTLVCEPPGVLKLEPLDLPNILDGPLYFTEGPRVARDIGESA